MQDYLPPKVHEAFLTTLTEFVLLPWREAMRSSLEGASQGGSQVWHPSDPLCRSSWRVWALFWGPSLRLWGYACWCLTHRTTYILTAG